MHGEVVVGTGDGVGVALVGVTCVCGHAGNGSAVSDVVGVVVVLDGAAGSEVTPGATAVGEGDSSAGGAPVGPASLVRGRLLGSGRLYPSRSRRCIRQRPLGSIHWMPPSDLPSGEGTC